MAALIYAAANMDDVVVLTGFYADPRVRARHVTVGQFVGMAILFSVCAAASLLFAVISPRYLGLAGLAPIALGLFKLWKISRRTDADGVAPSKAERRHRKDADRNHRHHRQFQRCARGLDAGDGGPRA